jgi:hypothetical protein
MLSRRYISLQSWRRAIVDTFNTWQPTTNMAAHSNIDHFLQDLLSENRWHILQAKCFDHTPTIYADPTLSNDILPMFKNRWATGPNQHLHTKEIWLRVRPSLLLASRMLTEPWLLLWFSQLTFGESHSSPSKPTTPYLTEPPYQRKGVALDTVVGNLAELGEVITIMFAPRSWKESAWGMTYNHKYYTPFRAEFNDNDWPATKDEYMSRSYKHGRPVIVMNASFQDYLMYDYPKSSTFDEFYRLSFAFAVTLCHEVAHAYHFWLHPGMAHEPLWNQEERKTELGYSWERFVLGRVICPLRYKQDVNNGVRMLFSTKLMPYGTTQEKYEALRRGLDIENLRMTTKDAHGVRRTWPILDPGSFRGSELFLNETCDTFVAGIQCIPMWWIYQWFTEEFWQQQVRKCNEARDYVAPRLENAFTIIYERDRHHGRVHRPLNANAPVDAKILRSRPPKGLAPHSAPGKPGKSGQ